MKLAPSHENNSLADFDIQQWFFSTVRFTKSGSVLPLYKISVLLKTGGAGVFIITRMINIVIKASSNDSIGSVVFKREDFGVGGGGSNPSMTLFFFFFYFILFSFDFFFILY